MNSSWLGNSKSSLETTGSQNQSSLPNKIAECWLRQNHNDYQQMLIESKEIELAILEQESVNKALLKGFQKKKKQIEDMQQELARATEQLHKKKHYLNDYYQYLNEKLKSGQGGISLFSKLEALSKSLTDKLEQERTNLQTSTLNMRIEVSKYEEQLEALREKKEAAQRNLEQLAELREHHLSQQEDRRREEKLQKMQEKYEYEHLQEELIKLSEERDQLERNSSMLKHILGIEEVHRNCWRNIEKAIKSELKAKMMEKNYKKSMAGEYRLKIPDLQQEVDRKKREVETLQEQLKSVMQQRDNTRRQLKQSKNKYDEAEGRLSLMSSRKSAGNI